VLDVYMLALMEFIITTSVDSIKL